jgi:hypothetical protein
LSHKAFVRCGLILLINDHDLENEMKFLKRLLTGVSFISIILYANDYTWQEINSDNSWRVSDLALTYNNQIYVGIHGESILHCLFSSTNLGESWNACPLIVEFPDPYYDNMSLDQVEIHPDETVWVRMVYGYDQRSLQKSADHGETWEMIGRLNNWLQYIDIVPNGDIYIEDNQLQISSDGGKHWASIYSWDEPPPIYLNGFKPKGNILKQIFGHNQDGFAYFYNGEWEWISIFYNDGYYDVEDYIGDTEINSLGHLFIRSSHMGLNRSTNYGTAWESIWDLSAVLTSNIYIDPNDAIYQGTSTGLHRSTDNGDTWENIGPVNKSINHFAINGKGNIIISSGNKLYFGRPPASGSFNFTAPGTSGMQLKMLKPFMIQWDYSGNPGNQVRIDLYRENKLIKNIVSATNNDHAYTWDVTRHIEKGSLYRFKISSVSQPSIYAFSLPFEIIENPDIRAPKVYTAERIPPDWIPVIDGNLNDPIWAQVESETLTYGNNPGDYDAEWNQFSDALVTWKAVWSINANRLYVAVQVQDDIRGEFDNGEYSGHYSPADDESIEIMTDGNGDGGEYWERFDIAQYWRVTAENQRNLLHYPTSGAHPFSGEGFETAVIWGEQGNWTCEIEMMPYDRYPDIEKNMWEGGRIAWDIWYNDSDNETYEDGSFKSDHQIGWNYLGPAWKVADYSGDIFLGPMITLSADTLQLQITTEPESGGSVTVTPDKAFYRMGDEVTLTAQANAGYQFVQWSGDASGAITPVTIQMNGHKCIAANFRKKDEPLYELEVTIPNITANTVIFTVPVQIGLCDNMKVSSYHCRLTYDSEQFTLMSISSQECLTKAWDQAEISYPDDHTISIAQSGPDSLTGPGELFQLIFQANTEGMGGMDLTWVEFEFNGGNPRAVTTDGHVTYEYEGVAVQNQNSPREYSLKQNIPNPFNPSTRIRYAIPEAGDIMLEIFKINGERVKIYNIDHHFPGEYEIVWDGRDEKGNAASSGTYIYRIRCNGFEKYMKALLIR